MKLVFSALTALVCAFTASTAYAACEDPAGPGVLWMGCDLTGADLAGANLTGANLDGANLLGTDFGPSMHGTMETELSADIDLSGKEAVTTKAMDTSDPDVVEINVHLDN